MNTTEITILETNIKAFIQAKGIGMGLLMNPFRLAMVGTNAGPGMLDIATVIGRENTIRRVSRGIEKIKN